MTQGTHDQPEGLWRVLLQTVGGTEVRPGQRIELRQETSEFGPVTVAVWTRFEDTGLTVPLPRETSLEVTVPAGSADDAIASAGAITSALTTMFSFCVNAFVSPPDPVLAYECSPGAGKRSFWQRHMRSTFDDLQPRRALNTDLLFPFLHTAFSSSDSERIGRAVSHYHLALNYWTTRGQPMALAHLYMALEALGPVAERRERERQGLAHQKEHALSRGVDVSKSNWRDVLLGWIRRDVLCDGDKETYDAARKASDGFEHGFMPLPEYRATASKHVAALLGHARRAVISLLDLSEPVRSSLLAKSALDIGPLWMEIHGELTGRVGDPDSLAEPGHHIPHPCFDWNITLDDARRTEDNRLTLNPRYNLTAHLAKDVSINLTHHNVMVGLSDPDAFDFSVHSQP